MVKTIALVGLGYVGLPLALALAKHFTVIGFDVNKKRIAELKENKDLSGEISSEQLSMVNISFTSEPSLLKTAEMIIVCVPTPIDEHNNPDLYCLESASEIIGKNLSQHTIVVYESTVYPGVTEEVCLPLLEKNSGLKCGKEFKVGYSPERINPGDKEHTIHKVTKIVSGMDEESLNIVDSVYSTVTKTHRASSIKVAEAAKVIENIQRDLNIALMNEFALIFDKMHINVKEVLEAAGTKWNFHKYSPGLVGGHCIGVDPYYLTYKAQELGYHPEVILAGRKINDNMHKHVVDLVIRGLNEAGKVLKDSHVVVMGLSFKENVRDARNSRALEIIKELKSYGIRVFGCDPLLGPEIVEHSFQVPSVEVNDLSSFKDIDGVILVSPHNELTKLDLNFLHKALKNKPLIVDVKGVWDSSAAQKIGFIYKSL